MSDNLNLKASKYFLLHEITYPGTVSLGTMKYFDPGYFEAIDFIREFFGKPVYANNWAWGGKMRYRGLRPFNCRVGSSKSQHKYGRGFDFNIKGMTPDEIRRAILENKIEFLKHGWTTIEDGQYAPTWVHIDGRWHPLAKHEILIVKP